MSHQTERAYRRSKENRDWMADIVMRLESDYNEDSAVMITARKTLETFDADLDEKEAANMPDPVLMVAGLTCEHCGRLHDEYGCGQPAIVGGVE